MLMLFHNRLHYTMSHYKYSSSNTLNRAVLNLNLYLTEPAPQVCSNTGMYAESWRHALHIQPSTSALLLSVRAALNMHAPGYIRGLKCVYSEHDGLLNAAELQVNFNICSHFKLISKFYNFSPYFL